MKIIVISIIFLLHFNGLAQSRIAREGSIELLNKEKLSGLMAVYKTKNKYILFFKPLKLKLELENVVSFKINNRRYEVLKFEDRFLPLEILVDGQLKLWYFEEENLFFIGDGNRIYALPKKYREMYLKTLFNQNCNCQYLEDKIKSKSSIPYLVEKISSYNLYVSNTKFKVNLKNRQFQDKKLALGLSTFLFFEHKIIKTSKDQLKITPSFNNSIGLTFRLKPINRIQYSFDIFYHRTKIKTDFVLNSSYNYWAESGDTIKMKSYETNRLILQNYFSYHFKFSENQRSIPYLFLGPTLGIYRNKNGMIINRKLIGFQTNINENLDLRNLGNYPFLAVGGVSGLGVDFKMNKTITINIQTGYFTDFKNFNSSFHEIDKIIVPNIRSEINKNIQSKIGVIFHF